MSKKIKKPDFFIVGAPKCGTTALYFYLRQHPQIFMPEVKEIHFFGSDLKFLHRKKKLTEDEYLSFFRDIKDEKRIGEVSVWYLYSKKAAKEIKAFNPNAQIIIMLRNPVDMIYSNYFQFLYNENEELNSFEEALEAENDRKKGKRIPKKAHFVQGLFYRETGKYYEQVKRYIEVFSRDKIHFIIFDDFVKRTAESYKQVLEFLNVDSTFIPSFKKINSTKKARSQRLRRILLFPPGWLFFLTRIIPAKIGKKAFNFLIEINKKKFEKPKMNDNIRKELISYFKKDVLSLSELIQYDLSFWLQ